VYGILDEAGLTKVTIFASGGIDEDFLIAATAASAPIDGFGIGTSLVTSADAPALDCAYKLQEYAGVPRRKLSAGKATWPGRKQVWRRYGKDGGMQGDTLAVEGEDQPGEPLIEPVMRNGQRLRSSPSLAEIRRRAARDLARLPPPLRRLESGQPYPVAVAEALVRLAAEAELRLKTKKP
jgi:nicotinate phosphoribosyltransferase